MKNILTICITLILRHMLRHVSESISSNLTLSPCCLPPWFICVLSYFITLYSRRLVQRSAARAPFVDSPGSNLVNDQKKEMLLTHTVPLNLPFFKPLTALYGVTSQCSLFLPTKTNKWRTRLNWQSLLKMEWITLGCTQGSYYCVMANRNYLR